MFTFCCFRHATPIREIRGRQSDNRMAVVDSSASSIRSYENKGRKGPERNKPAS